MVADLDSRLELDWSKLRKGDTEIIPEWQREGRLFVVGDHEFDNSAFRQALKSMAPAYFTGKTIGTSLKTALPPYSEIYPETPPDVWVQDHFDVTYLKLNGGDLVPLILFPENSEYYDSYTFPEYYKFPVIQTPYFFEGGNIMQDKIGREKLLFVGSDTFKNKYNKDMGEDSIKFVMKTIYGADRVVVIGENLEAQPEKVFHLDQVMLPLGNGLMAVPKLIGADQDGKWDPKEWHRQMKEAIIYEFFRENPKYINKSGSKKKVDKYIRENFDRFVEENRDEIAYAQQYSYVVGEELALQGYHVINLQLDIRHLLNCQSPANCSIYTNPETGKREVLAHRFPDQVGEYLYEGLNMSNVDTIKANGISRARIVRERYWPLKGNTHCVTKMIL